MRNELSVSVGRVLGIPVATVLFSETLRYSFEHLISPTYSYTGLIYKAPDRAGYAFAVCLVALVALMLPARLKQPSDLVIWIVFTVSAAPSILVTHYIQVTHTPGQATKTGMVVAATLLMVRYLAAARPRGIHLSLRITHRAFWQLVIVFSALIYAYLILTVGFSVRYLSLSQVYSARAEFEDSIAGAGPLVYVLPIQYYVLNPLLIARGLFGRRPTAFFAGFLGELYIYSGNGSKTLLFGVLAVIAIWLLFRRRPAPHGFLVFGGVGLGALAMTLYDLATQSINLTTLFVRRELAVPGALTAAYVSIFDTLPKMHWSDIIPGTSSPYFINPTHIVGALFINNQATSANVGLFGHGFLNEGYLGVFIEGAYLALLMWILDIAADGVPTAIASAVIIMPALAFAEASAFTVTLTHGFLAGVVVLFATPRTGWGRQSSPPDSGASQMTRKKAGAYAWAQTWKPGPGTAGDPPHVETLPSR